MIIFLEAIYGNIHGHIIHVISIQMAAPRSPIPLGLDGSNYVIWLEATCRRLLLDLIVASSGLRVPCIFHVIVTHIAVTIIKCFERRYLTLILLSSENQEYFSLNTIIYGHVTDCDIIW